ncbi:acetyltransferase [Acidisoma silvae]|uniref:Acetyltransferase n=1 Tax=Acidisoma silvae TaxID=2802396 RepID=A0A964DYK5_9PROT|nr:acetyltransferase [Acidisoma silvae]
MEDGVWLGEEVAVMKGAVIGAGSAVGFRSVVTTTIPPNSLAVGIPARVIRDRITWR